jgi:hypothetical protein
VSCPAGAAAATTTARTLPAQAIARAAAVKTRHAQGLLRQAGIQGVGVGASDDDPAEPAIVVYVVAGMGHAPVPSELDGIPTKVVSTDRFRASGWNETVGATCRK